ncbi:MAG: aminopeptidase P family N-terminal domain-containing protein, partial [Rhizobiaceae bacterium]
MIDFDITEYETRTERAQDAMMQQGIGALFLMSEPEVRYFTGFRTLFWQSPTRPWFVIVPAIGKPIAAIPEIGAPLMQQTWIDEIHCWSSPDEHDDGISILKSLLEDYARVGLLMGRESQLRMPYSDFQRLRLDLTKTQFVDATPLMTSLRFVKSEAEINVIATICGHAQRAFDRIPEIVEEGLTLKEVFR